MKYCSHSHSIAIPYLVDCSIMLLWVFLTIIFCSNNFFLTSICCRTNKQLLPLAGKPRSQQLENHSITCTNHYSVLEWASAIAVTFYIRPFLLWVCTKLDHVCNTSAVTWSIGVGRYSRLGGLKIWLCAKRTWKISNHAHFRSNRTHWVRNEGTATGFSPQ